MTTLFDDASPNIFHGSYRDAYVNDAKVNEEIHLMNCWYDSLQQIPKPR